jgi:hypothetical protein
MLKSINLPAFILLAVMAVACKHTPGTKEVKVPEKVSEAAVAPVAVDVSADELVSFISGVKGAKNSCYASVGEKVNWDQFSGDIDSLFSAKNSLRMKKMKEWSGTELVKNSSVTTVFYPFSGPDFLNANIYYPDASQYILIGLEPIGELPDICSMKADSVKSYLKSVNRTVKELLKRSYFITKNMSKDLSKTKMNGTLPMMSILIKRTGHQIVSIHRVGIDSLGNCQVIDNLKNTENFVRGVKIEFISPSSNKIQSVLYFKTDISDKGLDKTPGFKKYLAGIPPSYTFLKAASFLMHYNDFKEIRDCVFNVSQTILQDDSGIAYKYFDKQKWKIKLYGKYSKPKGEFSYIKEPDLEEAFKKAEVGTLPYYLGYNWGTDHTSLLYAVKN